MDIVSKRRFAISGFEGGKPICVTYSLNTIFSKQMNTELIYSLREEIDAIMDLKPNEAKIMHSNRDTRTDLFLIIVLRLN